MPVLLCRLYRPVLLVPRGVCRVICLIFCSTGDAVFRLLCIYLDTFIFPGMTLLVRRWLSLLGERDRLVDAQMVELLRLLARLPAAASRLAVGQAAAELIIECIDRLKPRTGAGWHRPDRVSPLRNAAQAAE